MLKKILDKYFTEKLLVKIMEEFWEYNIRFNLVCEGNFCKLYANYTDKRELKEDRYICRWYLEFSIYELLNLGPFLKRIEERLDSELKWWRK